MAAIDLDARIRREGMTLQTMRAAIPAGCHVIDEARAWRSLGRALGLIALSQAALALLPVTWGWSLLWQLPALLVLWLVAGLAFTGLFVLGHDCGHQAFSRSRVANAVVGHLAMGLLLTGLTNWVLGHNQHHKHANVRRKDTNWPENMVTRAEYAALPAGDRVGLRLAYGTPLGVLLGYWITIVRYVFLERLYPQITLTDARRRLLRVSNLVTLALSGGLCAGLVALGGGAALVTHYLGPVFVAAALGAFLTLLMHSSDDAIYFDAADATPMRSQVVSVFNVRFPRWFEAAIFDINIHLPHHLAPMMPWYHLRAANDALRARFPDYVQERPVSLGWIRAMWRTPLLARAGDHYRTVAIAEDAGEQRGEHEQEPAGDAAASSGRDAAAAARIVV